MIQLMGRLEDGGTTDIGGTKFSNDDLSGMFAKGGAIEHGLMEGDSIAEIKGSLILIQNRKQELFLLDIEKGNRKPISITEWIKMADGGYMAKGGAIDEKFTFFGTSENGWYVKDKEKNKFINPIGKKVWESKEDAIKDIKKEKFSYADGGYMAKGGEIKVGDKVRSTTFNGIEGEVKSKQKGMLFIQKEDGTHDVLRIDEVEKMAKGGKTTFKDKVKSISKSLVKRKKVSPSVQKDYGKTYSKDEAIDSAKRIVGAMRKKEMMGKGGKLIVNGDDFSFLLNMTDKELSKRLDLVREQQNINGKQYFNALSRKESTKKIEDSRINLDNQERAIIEARIKSKKKR